MISRFLNIANDINKGRSLFLFGPRGVGKTSLVRNTLENIPHIYFNLLLRGSREPLQSDPSLFCSQVNAKLPSEGSLVIAIDEIQLLPELLDEVHALIEESGKHAVFVLTGSSARKLKRSNANMLGGRALTRSLHPLSSIECELDLLRVLKFGTLPAFYFDANPDELLESYVDTYLREEIQQEAVTRNLPAFSRFIELAGQMNGATVNFAKLARQLNIHHGTVQAWFSVLEDTLLVTRVDGWSRSVKKQLVQAPKFFFFDCGILRAINRELQLPVDRSTYRYGALFENFIVQEIVRYNSYQNLRFAINHWRTSTGQEVDIVLSRNATEPPIAIEIKSAINPVQEELTGLRSFQSEEPNARLWCFCCAEHRYKRAGIEFFPWQEGLANLLKL